MNTNQIRKFATEARTRLLKGVSNQLKAFFDEKGNPHIVPTQVQGGCIYGETLRDEAFYRAWKSLNKHIDLYGFKTTVEEVAYTWFNRLVAINILAKNSLAEPVLSFSNPMIRVPLIVEQARTGQFPQMSVNARNKLNELLNDPSKTLEQFSFLIDHYCSTNPIIQKCLSSVDDYSFLLLPNNILAEGELIDMLNRSDYISDEDYRSPELIGWLYQFYISEKKDEVFAKKGKFESDEIPAATQIFTPNWIVKYMVQNSIGRIYLDNEPYSDIAKDMKYLVPSESSADKFTFVDVKELTCADLACGSGHILNECFDLLYDIYIEQGYSRRDAVESIFANNLTGIDIDTRAKQMATFALLLKACQRDASFADAHAMPRVLDMPDPYPRKLDLRDTLSHFFLGGTPKMIDETREAIELFDNAKDLGSIMKFNISPATREAIARRLSEYREAGHSDIDDLFRYLDIILALTAKYAALVMNPPYMGSGNMNSVLSKYVKDNYPDGKADLCTTFMIMQAEKTCKGGYYANIIPPSWMFLSTFEGLRQFIIENQSIQSLLHLSRGVFGADFGSVSCVIQNAKSADAKGTYFRLIERTFQEFDQEHLQMLFEKTLANHDFKYFFADYSKDISDIVYSGNGAKIYYPQISQSNFAKIPGSPIGYWVSEKIQNIFYTQPKLADISRARLGQNTGDNNRFLRNWWEVANQKIGFGLSHGYDGMIYKWVPYTKGGILRRWYGNYDTVLNWENNGAEVKDYCVIRNQGKHWSRYIQSLDCFYKQGLVFPRIGSGNFCTRFVPEGSIFDVNAPGCFPENNDKYILAYLNTKVNQYFLSILCPTLSFQVGDVSKVPFIITNTESSQEITQLTESNIKCAKSDWDAHETSWDFQTNPLVAIDHNDWFNVLELSDKTHYLKTGEVVESICGGINTHETKLKQLVWNYKTKWEYNFYQLHANEEELNRQFIEIYGLEDELTPDVPLDEITILQQGEISIENNAIVWHDDVIAKQLISYAIGCWFGRYRLDKPGLHIAHPAPTPEEICTYSYNGNDLEIDDDGIMPILSADSSFADNACHRVRDFLRIAFGDEDLISNINWIESAIGKSLEAYFAKDFWKDHKKIYQNRPIYWLFSSKKGAFQCLAYMHRMDAYTAERVRSKYLLPHMEWLSNQIADLVAAQGTLATAQSRMLDRLRKELDECREYHDRLHVVADHQIAFDLDDGVVVNYAKFGDILAKIK